MKTNTLIEIPSNNLHIGVSPLLTEYDFRASCFCDGYMSMSVMAEKIANDIRFEEKLKKLSQEKRRIKNA